MKVGGFSISCPIAGEPNPTGSTGRTVTSLSVDEEMNKNNEF